MEGPKKSCDIYPPGSDKYRDCVAETHEKLEGLSDDLDYINSLDYSHKFENDEEKQRYDRVLLDLRRDGIEFSSNFISLFEPELAFDQESLNGFVELLKNEVTEYVGLLMQVDRENFTNEAYVKALIKLKDSGVDCEDLFTYGADVSDKINNIKYLENLLELHEAGIKIDVDFILNHDLEAVSESE